MTLLWWWWHRMGYGYGYGVSLSSVGIFHIVSIDFLHNRTQSSPNRPTDRPNARVKNGISVQSAGKIAKRALKAWVFINEIERKKPIKPTTQSQHKEWIPLNCQSLTYWKRQNGYWFRSDFVISILIESTRLECCPSTKLKWNACISTLTGRTLNVYTHRRTFQRSYHCVAFEKPTTKECSVFFPNVPCNYQSWAPSMYRYLFFSMHIAHFISPPHSTNICIFTSIYR